MVIEMKMVFCNGGLANQLYQFIFAKYLEMQTGESVILDDMYFFITDAHNGFELNKVFPHAKMTLLSQCFDEDVWSYMVDSVRKGAKVVELLKENGINLMVAFEGNNVHYDRILSKDSPVAHLRIPDAKFLTEKGMPNEIQEEDVYYVGYFLNQKYYQEIKSTMLIELQFLPILDEKNKKYFQQIQETFSIALHIRRGDFVQFNLDLPTMYYKEVVSNCKVLYQLKQKVPVYYLFSDDIEWCKEHVEEFGFDEIDKVVFIEGNTGNGNNYIDLQLMSHCDFIIASKSSFCFAASLLNIHGDSYISPPPRN